MQWAAPLADSWSHPSTRIRLLQSAITGRPDRGDLWRHLGELLAVEGRPGESIEAYAQALRTDPSELSSWSGMVRGYVQAGRAEAALAVAAPSDAPGLDQARGDAFLQLGEIPRGEAALRAAIFHDDLYSRAALRRLLELMALNEDGAPTLALCDALPDRLSRTAYARAFRAIALSRVGRTAEARRLVDLERHVVRLPFSPPPETGGPAMFNDALAKAILTAPDRGDPGNSEYAGREIRYQPPAARDPRFSALYAFIRDALVRFVDLMPGMGLDEVMFPPPAVGAFGTANTVLRAEGRNGQHIHGKSYISSVYHVLLPNTEDDTRGSLVLGCCDQQTGGYQPCWGTRVLKPMAGWLTLFPAHFFHDVIPSGKDEPRISIASDLLSAENVQAG